MKLTRKYRRLKKAGTNSPRTPTRRRSHSHSRSRSPTRRRSRSESRSRSRSNRHNRESPVKRGPETHILFPDDDLEELLNDDKVKVKDKIVYNGHNQYDAWEARVVMKNGDKDISNKKYFMDPFDF